MKNPIAAWMPLNLQLFAEPGEGEGTSQEGTAQEQNTAAASEGAQRTYTHEEVQAMLNEANRRAQSEADRRVTQALNSREREYQRQMSLSGLDEHERAIRERDQQIEDLQASLREEQANRNHLEVVRVLADRGMPVEFADLIDVGQNLEQAQQRIDQLNTVWNRAVEDAANRLLAGRRAPAKGNSTAAVLTRDEYRRMTLRQQQELADRDPDLYKRMNE